MLVVRDNPGSSWRRVGGPETEEEVVQIDDSQFSSSSGIKRPLSPSALDGPETKRAKGSSPTPHLATPSCLAPPQHPLAATIMSNLNKSDPTTSLGAGDMFLSLGFRDRWCHCNSVHLKHSNHSSL
jgi:E3 ubiquitin-protein ligase UBR7